VISFVYKAPFDNGLTEHEFDHILIGNYDKSPIPNPDEVADWKWVSLEKVAEDIKKHPEQYTAWFQIIFDKFYNHLKQVVLQSTEKRIITPLTACIEAIGTTLKTLRFLVHVAILIITVTTTNSW